MKTEDYIRARAKAAQALVGALLIALAMALAVGWWVASELGWAPGVATGLLVLGLAVFADAQRNPRRNG